MSYLIVFLGGGLGAMLRHAVNLGAARWLGMGFPAGTLMVNVTGSFLIGVLAGYFAFKADAPQAWRLFLVTGLLGGYTTFSAFSLDAVLLWERHAYGLAIGYVASSVVLSLFGLACGLWLFRQLA